jgi:putative inorganic carbon (HCO3(-)) transporter
MRSGTLIGQVTQWVSAGELAILLLASPFFLLPRPSFAPAWLLLPLLWLVRRHNQGHFIPRTAIDWSILGLLIMVLIGTLATPDFLFSLGKIVGTIYGLSIFYAIVSLAKQQRNALLVAAIVVALGTAAAMLGLLGTEWIAKWSVMRPIRPYLPEVIRGVPGYESGFNANQVSGAVIMFTPLQIAMLIGLRHTTSLPRVRRLWLGVGLGLSLFLTSTMILLAQSRAAWAASALGLLAMGAVVGKRFRPVFIGLFAAGLIALAILGPVALNEQLVDQELMADSGEVNWEARLELWSRGLWAIAEFPLTGTGMNMFRRVVWELYPLFHFPYGKDIGHSHQTYLQVALDLGIPGLISYLAILGGTLYAGWRVYRNPIARLTQLIALGGLTGLAVQALWGLTDAVALGAKQSFLWWTMLALISSVAVLEEGRQTTSVEAESSASQSLSATPQGSEAR